MNIVTEQNIATEQTTIVTEQLFLLLFPHINDPLYMLCPTIFPGCCTAYCALLRIGNVPRRRIFSYLWSNVTMKGNKVRPAFVKVKMLALSPISTLILLSSRAHLHFELNQSDGISVPREMIATLTACARSFISTDSLRSFGSKLQSLWAPKQDGTALVVALEERGCHGRPGLERSQSPGHSHAALKTTHVTLQINS
eukprot:767565-Hanusia_phi.AAC.2